MSDTLLASIRTPADLKALTLDQLPQLAQEMRQVICESVSRTGGHLAPNLGVVELTIALHYVFDFGPTADGGYGDRLLFDVGHQCYPHKLLTGRSELMKKLRQRGGMSGFPEPRESDHDLFSVGHAGTAISTAVGLARGDTVQGLGHRLVGAEGGAPGVGAGRRVVSLIGDASIVNGLAMEGLNAAGTLGRQFLVVLNDNGMSIAKPQGAMAQYFDRMRVSPLYEQFKKRAHDVLMRLPGGQTLEEMYLRAGEAMKHAITTGHMFEHFGLVCVGPIDGHDFPTLIEMLSELKDFDKPALLHVKTVKGKGFDFSTGDPTRFHSPSAFVVEGCRVEMKKSGRAFTTAFADALIGVMKRDERVFAVTAAMPDGTGLNKVMPLFPQRTCDTGICESHAMDFCAGLAKSGLKPFFAVYSTFVQRAIDQAFQEASLQGLAIRVCLDRAGFVGEDGAVHHGFMDIALFKPLPGAVMLAASDEPNLIAALEFMRRYEAGLSVLRYPRANVPEHPLMKEVPAFEMGKALFIQRTDRRPDPVLGATGSPGVAPGVTPGAAPEAGMGTGAGTGMGHPDLAILAYGTQVYEAALAMTELQRQGYDVALYDARFAKPVDVALLRGLLLRGIPILTVEDHFLPGGFGSCVLEACDEHRLPAEHVHRLAMPERWVHQAGRKDQLAEVGLDPAGIARTVRSILDRRATPTAIGPSAAIGVRSIRGVRTPTQPK